MSNNGNINLPDALKTKPLPTISTMSVDTNILDPVVINNTFARFVLEKKGILDAGSLFTFCLTNNSTDMDNNIHLPVKTGIHAIIQSAVLRVGTKIISNNEDYAFYQTIKRQFKTTEEKQLKDMVKYGTQEGLEPANAGGGRLQLSSCIYAGAGAAGRNHVSVSPVNSAANSPVFQIKLSELFPMLRSVQLPLFVLNEPVSIELTFRTQADGVNGELGIAFPDPGGLGNYDTGLTLQLNQVKFLADYLTYDDNTMAQTAAQVMSAQGIQMPYEDLLLTLGNVPAQGVAAAVEDNRTTTEIAVAGRMVRSCVVHTSNGVVNNLCGIYASVAHLNPDSYNLRINDILYYPNDILREAQKQHELSKCFGRDIEIHSCEYSLDLQSNKQVVGQASNNPILAASTLNGLNQSQLAGAQHFIGIDMSKSPMNMPGNGTLIGQKPIQFNRTFRRVAAENQALTQRIFSLVERNMIIKNGAVQVSN